MTNSQVPDFKLSDNEPARRSANFHRLMTDLGVEQFHGVELLRLVKMTSNAYDMLTAERMRDENLSAPRWRLLWHLFMAAQEGDVLSPTQLSQMQRLSKNTVSAHLRSLEEQGLIAREVDPNDLRQFRIRLTEAGRELVRTSTPGHMRFLNDLTDALTPEEITHLQHLLQKLHHSLLRHLGAHPCDDE